MTTLFTRRRKSKKSLVFTEVVLLLAGFVALGWAGYTVSQGYLYNSWQDYKFERALQGEQPSLIGYGRFLVHGATRPHGKEEAPSFEQTEPPPSPRKLHRAEAIGRIEIPRVSVSAVVKEGVDATTLSRAVGHVPRTALPGEKGNVGVAAHRDTFFRGLRRIRQGDTIRVVTMEGVYVYKVDSMKIVWPKNIEVLDPTPDKMLTLVTCYPFNYIGSAPKRFIVAAKQVGFEELAAKSAAPPKTGL